MCEAYKTSRSKCLQYTSETDETFLNKYLHHLSETPTAYDLLLQHPYEALATYL
jgi:hypothetical protein